VPQPGAWNRGAGQSREIDPMNDPLTVGSDDSREIRELMAQFDAPAYVRRARRVEGSYEQLIEQCRRQRQEWLAMVRTRLGQLAALADAVNDDWRAIASILSSDADVLRLRRLHDELRPALRVSVTPNGSPRVLRRAAVALRHSIARFNERWLGFLGKIDLAPLNALRDGYNSYYVLEKECALRSPRLAREGFRPIPMVTLQELTEKFPPLDLPRLAEEDPRSASPRPVR
jgi:hypothetical protein